MKGNNMDTKKQSKPKEKRRNNEKRKEKSRDAARCRRSRETEVFSELSACLPLPRTEVEQLDKASIMRLAISYLKVRAVLPQHKKTGLDISALDQDLEVLCDDDSAVLKALDGFLLVIAPDGDLAYVSTNVNEYLGISQVDLMGQNIYEFSHPCDHDELKEVLSIKQVSAQENEPRNLFARLKCTLTTKGRSVNIKSASYKVVHCTGHILMADSKTSDKENDETQEGDEVSGDVESNISGGYFVAIGRLIPHPSNIEIRLDSKTFLTKHNLKLQFTYVDDKMKELFDYSADDLLGHSLFQCHHAGDSESLLGSFKSLFSKGQSETTRYRFLARCGGYAWVVTQSTVIYDKMHKPQSVVSVHYAVSGIEHQNDILSSQQLSAFEKSSSQRVIKEEPDIADIGPRSVTSKILGSAPINIKPIKNQSRSVPVQILVQPPSPLPIAASIPVSVTAKIFAPLDYPKPKIVTDKIFAPLETTKPQIVSKIFAPVETPKPQIVTDKIFAPLATTKPQIVSGRIFAPSDTPQPQIVTDKIFAPLETTKPQIATGKIFAPRTEEMNTGFLMFSDEDGLTMLKEEPDDLTHLAPTAGDVCIPLADNPFMTDIFDDFILSDSYCSLLPEDLNSLDSQGSARNSNSDPFISYRDDDIDQNSRSDNSLSPALSKSPGTCSLPSLCSPGDSFNEEDPIPFMSMSMDCCEEDMDLSMRAPYIPMNDNDDLPLLMSEDLMWGALPDHVNMHRELRGLGRDKREQFNRGAKGTVPDDSSSLAQLLCGGDVKRVNGQINSNDLRESSDSLGSNVCSKRDEICTDRKNSWTVGNKVGIALNTLTDNTLLTNGKKVTSKRPINQYQQELSCSKRLKNEPEPSQLLKHLITPVENSRLGTTIGTANQKTRNKTSNWNLDSGGNITSKMNDKLQLHQTSDSVLMNLLVSGCDDDSLQEKATLPPFQDLKISPSLDLNLQTKLSKQQPCVRLSSILPTSVRNASPVQNVTDAKLVPYATKNSRGEFIKNSFSLESELRAIPSLLDLNEQDYEYNAPVEDLLLQGSDLLYALDITMPVLT